MLRDVIELRQSHNKWIPRREQHYDPKTIDQIHREAQMEKMQERGLAAQLPAKDNKRKKGA
jgi:translation initiation factor 4G